MTFYFGSWRCNCTSLQAVEGKIPSKCPNHGRELLGPICKVEAPADTEIGVKAAAGGVAA